MPCNQCGECCKHVMFSVRGGPNARHFYRARGFHVIVTSSTSFNVVIANKCPHLLPSNLCSIHDSLQRPKACRDYPTTDMSQIFPDCGFNGVEECQS